MSYRSWKKKDRTNLRKLVAAKVPIEDIEKKLKRSKISILGELIEEKGIDTPKARRTNVEKEAINFLDMNLRDRDYKNVWSSILDFQRSLDEKSIEQNIANIAIKGNKWVGVAFLGDMHIGNMATDYKSMLHHRDLIRSSKDLYVTFNGDYCDNYLPSSHVSGMFEALFPPAVQKNLAKDYIESVADKVLALTSGCHDIFGLKASDFDVTEYLAKHSDAVYLGNGGLINLTVGKVTYRVMVRHKYRFHSGDNPTQTCKKMFEKMGGFDVGVVSHNHIAAIEESTKEGMDGNLKRIFVRAGTYKTHDRYGRQLGFSEGDIGVPVVIFNPNTRDMRGFQNLNEGIDYLNYLNKGK